MSKTLLLTLALTASIIPASQAAITITVSAGELLTSSSTIVSDTSLWALIYDADGNNALPGGLSTVTSNSLTTGDQETTFNAFRNKGIIAGDTIGGDKILRVFEVDSANTSGAAGVTLQVINSFVYATEGVAGGGKWGIYWFPGLTTANATLPDVPGFEVGGFFQLTPDSGAGGTIGTVLPASDTGTASAAFLNSNYGGDTDATRLTAIVAVPEPSTLALSALGLAALLRRRRN